MPCGAGVVNGVGEPVRMLVALPVLRQPVRLTISMMVGTPALLATSHAVARRIRLTGSVGVCRACLEAAAGASVAAASGRIRGGRSRTARRSLREHQNMSHIGADVNHL